MNQSDDLTGDYVCSSRCSGERSSHGSVSNKGARSALVEEAWRYKQAFQGMALELGS